MKTSVQPTLAFGVAFALLIGLLSGCGGSSDITAALQEIPFYPNAIEGESMEQSLPGGFLGGVVTQFTTTDPYEEVLEFYTDALYQYETEVMEQESELGRQTAISIPQKKGVITVAIQEFTEEETVNITLMAVGS
jgi:hypothetical protein